VKKRNQNKKNVKMFVTSMTQGWRYRAACDQLAKHSVGDWPAGDRVGSGAL